MRYVPVRRNFEDLLDDVFNAPMFDAPAAGNLMKTDIREKDGKYMLDIELPGFKKEEIKIALKEGNLTISASHHESQEEKDAKGNIVRQERYSGSCSRSFYVGDTMKESDIKANYANGELKLEMPNPEKKIQEEEKYITIE